MSQSRVKYEPPILTFRVRMLGGLYAPQHCERIWREIMVASNQRLDELGDAIPLAFGLEDAHLWSFYFGKPGKKGSVEYTIPMDAFVDGDDGGDAIAADTIKIRDAPFPPIGSKGEVEYLLDLATAGRLGFPL